MARPGDCGPAGASPSRASSRFAPGPKGRGRPPGAAVAGHSPSRVRRRCTLVFPRQPREVRQELLQRLVPRDPPVRQALGVDNVWDFKVLPDGSSRLLDRSSLEAGRLYSFSAQGTKLWEAAFTGQAVELAVGGDGAWRVRVGRRRG